MNGNGDTNSSENRREKGDDRDHQQHHPRRSLRPLRRSPYAVLNLPESGRFTNHRRWQQPQVGDKHENPLKRAGGRISRRAISDEEVREAYKRLSRLFHPDKRPPGKEREEAQEIFIELLNACESLVCHSALIYLVSMYESIVSVQ